MIKHTQEPWVVVPSIPEEGSECFWVQGCNGQPLGTIDGPQYGLQEANAARMVACVNACQGIPTEELEAEGLFNTVGKQLVQAQTSLSKLQTAARALEVAANTVAYYYDKRPENFAASLESLRRATVEVRALIENGEAK